MSNNTAVPATFVSLQVVAHGGEEREIGGLTITSAPSMFVIGGEYKDEPDLVIEIRHAIDEDGIDITSHVAHRIAALLEGK